MRDMLRRDWEPRATSLTIEYLGNTAEARKRNRDGKPQTVIRESRNGLPEPCYAYRGTGEDIYLGTYGDPWLDTPRDW
jgi:hypothetical protein